MPIIVKDYTWSQTNNTIHIRVPLNPVRHEKVDLFPSDRYIKAHFSPFLFEVFLLHDVNIKKSKCLVVDDLIVLDLMKIEEMTWECLEKELTKEEKMKIRQEVLEKCQEEAKQESEDKRVRKSQLDRYAVQQAMEIDSQQHNLMDSRRDSERKKAMDQLEDWRVSQVNDKEVKQIPAIKDKHETIIPPSQQERRGVEIVELPPSDDENETAKTEVAQSKPAKPVQKQSRKPIKIPVKSEYIEKKKKEQAKRVLPRLRETMDLEITHTPRTFPTPSRESTAAEEQAWLKNVTLARRATGKELYSH